MKEKHQLDSAKWNKDTGRVKRKEGSTTKVNVEKLEKKEKGLYVSRMLLNPKQVENAVVGFGASKGVCTWRGRRTGAEEDSKDRNEKLCILAEQLS